MATKKEPAAQAVENAVETVEKTEAKAEKKDDGMVTMPASWATPPTGSPTGERQRTATP